MIISVKKLNLDGKFSGSYVLFYEESGENDGRPLYVPHNEENMHYQEILEWVAEGNTIEEAD